MLSVTHKPEIMKNKKSEPPFMFYSFIVCVAELDEDQTTGRGQYPNPIP